MFDIVDFRSIVARIYVPEKHLPDLQLNSVARVTPTALGTEEIAGYLLRISPVVEAKTGLIKVTIGFKETRQLRPGMYVNVELVTARRTDAILLSKRALVYDGESTYAFRVLPDRTVERVLVEARLDDETNVEPARGFKEGDQVVVAGQTGLKTGLKVRLPGDPAQEERKTEQAERTNTNGKS
jgi:membrane fusion protein (multidrug efflux system)